VESDIANMVVGRCGREREREEGRGKIKGTSNIEQRRSRVEVNKKRVEP